MSQILVTGEAKIRDIQGPVVANSGVITALDGAANQYVRGDGTLASFPTSGGGGSSVSYYLNGSVNQGTFGGSTYYQMSKNAIVGTGTNFSISSDGLLAQFITDANDPDVVSIPSGNWNVEFFMGVSASSGSLASFYVEIYKYDGSTFTLLATNVATPEFLTNTTTVDAYFTSVAMPLSSMALTDRLAVRIYANVASKTVTLYTEDNRLCQVVTTFSKGILSINNLTDQSQNLTVGTAGTNFNIDSSGDTHTFNLPVASATNTGKLSSTDWSTFNNKVPYTGATGPVNLGAYDLTVNDLTIGRGNGSVSDNTAIGVASLSSNTTGANNTAVGSGSLQSNTTGTSNNALGSGSLYSNTTGANNVAIGNAALFGNVSGDSNTSIGVSSLQNSTGVRNTAIGYDAGNLIMTGSYNTIIGSYTGTSSMSSNVILADGQGNIRYRFDGNNNNFYDTTIFGDYALMNIGVALAKTSGSTLYASTNGYANLQLVNAGSVNSLYINDGDTLKYSKLSFNNAADYTYTFPASSGTVALTSNIPTVSGTTNYIPKFTGTNSIGNSSIQDDGSNISINGFTVGYYSTTLKINNSSLSSGIAFTQGNLLKNEIYSYNDDLYINSLSGNINFATQSSNRAMINNAGRLLLGTTTDNGSLLQVAGSATFSGNVEISGSAYPQLNIVGNSSTSGGGVRMFGSTTQYAEIYGEYESSTNGQMFFRTRRSGTITTALTLASTGAATFSSSVTAANGAFGAVGGFIVNYSGASTSSRSWRIINDQSVFGDFAIQQSTSQTGTTYNQPFYINPTGNVGIGTSSPVSETGHTSLTINGSSISRLDFMISGVRKGLIYSFDTGFNVSSQGANPLILGSNDTERMRITSSGVFMVGTTTVLGGGGAEATNGLNIGPSGVLVNNSTGDFNAYFAKRSGYSFGGLIGFYVAGSQVGSITTNGSSTSYVTSSDYRLKEDLKEINGLEKVSAIKVYDYKWKNSEHRMDGVLAHELAEIVPYAVNGDKDGKDMQGVDYSKLVPILIKSIQELQAKIVTLESKLN